MLTWTPPALLLSDVKHTLEIELHQSYKAGYRLSFSPSLYLPLSPSTPHYISISLSLSPSLPLPFPIYPSFSLCSYFFLPPSLSPPPLSLTQSSFAFSISSLFCPMSVLIHCKEKLLPWGLYWDQPCPPPVLAWLTSGQTLSTLLFIYQY